MDALEGPHSSHSIHSCTAPLTYFGTTRSTCTTPSVGLFKDHVKTFPTQTPWAVNLSKKSMGITIAFRLHTYIHTHTHIHTYTQKTRFFYPLPKPLNGQTPNVVRCISAAIPLLVPQNNFFVRPSAVELLAKNAATPTKQTYMDAMHGVHN